MEHGLISRDNASDIASPLKPDGFIGGFHHCSVTPPSTSSRDSDRDRLDLGIDRELLLQLSRPIPGRLLFHTLVEWALIVGTITLACWANNVWISLAAIVFIATRQHALLIMMHEFSHRQFSRTRPVLNDAIGDFLTALPLLISIHGFRAEHLLHHRAPSTDADPNWVSSVRRSRFQFPRSRAGMMGLLCLYCLGVYTPQELKGLLFEGGMAIGLPRGAKLRQVGFWLSVLAACWAFNLWVIVALYWFLPMVTVLMAVVFFREVAEHHGMPKRGLEATRSVIGGPVESFLIAPYSVGFHAEHHLYPSVPFCRLPQLHCVLSGRTRYKEHAVVTRGYFTGLLRELSGKP